MKLDNVYVHAILYGHKSFKMSSEEICELTVEMWHHELMTLPLPSPPLPSPPLPFPSLPSPPLPPSLPLDMANIVALLFICMFIFAVLGSSFFGNDCPQHFGSLGTSEST